MNPNTRPRPHLVPTSSHPEGRPRGDDLVPRPYPIGDEVTSGSPTTTTTNTPPPRPRDEVVIANDLPYSDRRTNPLRALQDTLAFASNDWSTSRATAWIYGIVLGWGCDENHEHDDDVCGGDGALEELTNRYGWTPEQIDHLRGLHARFAELAADQ